MAFKTTTYLVMNNQEEAGSVANAGGLALTNGISHGGQKLAEIHAAVGAPYGWRPKFPDNPNQGQAWDKWLSQAGKSAWVVEVDGVAAGLAVLDVQQGGDVEVVSFGLVPQFVGRGLGKIALARTIEKAWQVGSPTKRVWLHTSSKDHPRALPNYLACGFTLAGAPVQVEEGTPSPVSMYGLGLGQRSVEVEPWARSPGWQPVADELRKLTDDLDAWASVVLVPISSEALKAAAYYRLPVDWAAMENRLDSGGMNALAFTTKTEVIDNDNKYTAPPTDEPLSTHHIESSAVVLIPNVGTLEVLANAVGYRFEEQHVQRMRESAVRIALIAKDF